MIIRGGFTILLLLAALAPAAADDTSPAAKEKQTLDSYATANKTCLEWTDGCAVCTRADGGTFHCSLPGIACQPTGLSCRKETPAPVSPPR